MIWRGSSPQLHTGPWRIHYPPSAFQHQEVGWEASIPFLRRADEGNRRPDALPGHPDRRPAHCQTSPLDGAMRVDGDGCGTAVQHAQFSSAAGGRGKDRAAKRARGGCFETRSGIRTKETGVEAAHE